MRRVSWRGSEEKAAGDEAMRLRQSLSTSNLNDEEEDFVKLPSSSKAETNDVGEMALSSWDLARRHSTRWAELAGALYPNSEGHVLALNRVLKICACAARNNNGLAEVDLSSFSSISNKSNKAPGLQYNAMDTCTPRTEAQ